MTKKIIGLTGGIASGKTLASNYLKKLGAFIIDADVVARDVVTPYSEINNQISNLLGNNSLLPDGNLNRAKIKQMVFSDKKLLKKYEDIILPAIRRNIIQKIKKAPEISDYILLVAPLLFEKEVYKMCDKTVVIDISKNTQIKRAMVRDSANREIIEKIISWQMPQQDKNSLADFIISNNSDKKSFYNKLEKLHHELVIFVNTH